MEIKNSLLMLIATIGTFILIYLLMFVPIPPDNGQILMAISGLALGFFFGSSVNKQRPPLLVGGDMQNAKISNVDPASPSV